MDIGFFSFFGFIPLLIYMVVFVLGVYICILVIRALHRTIRWLDLSIHEKESRIGQPPVYPPDR
ncbi:hypothetical protein M5W83_17560 [Paenibacillus thiaminolyticus]|uniref:Uncharacterized protein n=1 Tax=Paenibacillus thiaminolyticus TaxID=49283 RepID=A0AAP9DS56_PANTH|nr:hypothetical protein [Paenibacillus thiaminolyticus]MCY9536570.1 hypothetical protein [Paenibacillus thiaminolyticus]MCY9601529.1 hypothetical protein [Paenibacillus thiaminolyticus]MCY9608953.1 hypothetical protein [Paenibacillus thiaminolyticus]MCY9612154.1 hypothetical protein [Paenibacillus thiaminolyticus]MCY9619589.1 hypothetical protein [Paenibacillus thiaminolyticus]